MVVVTVASGAVGLAEVQAVLCWAPCVGQRIGRGGNAVVSRDSLHVDDGASTMHESHELPCRRCAVLVHLMVVLAPVSHSGTQTGWRFCLDALS